MSFQIFYTDGPAPKDTIPSARGVQAIVQDQEDVGTEIVTAADYYIKTERGWVPVDIFGLYDFLLESGLVLFGRMMSNKEYSTLMHKAIEVKNHWGPFERRP